MTNRIHAFRFPLWVLLLVVGTVALGCMRDDKSKDTDTIVNANRETDSLSGDMIDTTTFGSTNTLPPPTPPPDEVAKKYIEDQTKGSPFRKLGCCNDEVKRRSQDCCCKEVLEGYKKMRGNNDNRIAELKKNDPILSDCRKLLIQEFEAADGQEEEPLY